MQKKVAGIDVPYAVISRMEKDGVSGIEIGCEILGEIYDCADGIHIMDLGDVEGTKCVIEFTRALK